MGGTYEQCGHITELVHTHYPSRQKGPLKPVNSALDTPQLSSMSTTACNTFQNASLLPTNYGSSLEAGAVPTAALYALSEMFSFAAHPES